MPEDKQRLEVEIFGKVQGVFFRSHIQRMARDLELTGWTRNELDESVKVVVEGEKEKLEEFLEFLKEGPNSAMVINIDIKLEKFIGEFEEFKIRY